MENRFLLKEHLYCAMQQLYTFFEHKIDSMSPEHAKNNLDVPNNKCCRNNRRLLVDKVRNT